jgi:hypothetical protein
MLVDDDDVVDLLDRVAIPRRNIVAEPSIVMVTRFRKESWHVVDAGVARNIISLFVAHD